MGVLSDTMGALETDDVTSTNLGSVTLQSHLRKWDSVCILISYWPRFNFFKAVNLTFNNPLTTSFTLEEMAELNGVVRDAHQVKADKLKLQCQVIVRDYCDFNLHTFLTLLI